MTNALETLSLDQRIVRYGGLRPCYNAFVDSRTPGSDAKENFTIIGPGVSENPNQHVHIALPHGFNIGGARQPPCCVNSQHSHDTAEVFVVHSGRWSFNFGEHGDDAQVECRPGDVISLPVHAFRGFTNIGDEPGFLWAVLGGDNPGRVLWAPQVFDLAREHGLVLLDSGRLVDTAAGEALAATDRPMPRTTPAQVEALRRYTGVEAAQLIYRDHVGDGETPVIAPGAPLGAADGFTLHRVDLAADAPQALPVTEGTEVIFVHRGTVTLYEDDASATLQAGDTATTRRANDRWLTAITRATLFVVRSSATID